MADKLKALIIEDNEDDVFLIQNNLGRDRFEFKSAGSLSEAKPLLNGENLDVAIVDMGLPDAQGVESVKAIVEHYPDLPVIVATGCSDDELAMQVGLLGASGFLHKQLLTGTEGSRCAICCMIGRALKQARERKEKENKRSELISRVKRMTENCLPSATRSLSVQL